MLKSFKRIFYSICFILFLFVSVQGQDVVPPGGPQYYVHFGKGRELQIDVQIWGHVKVPGMYSVPQTTDIIALISLAGGPVENADLTNIKVVRSNPEPQIIKVNLRKYMGTGNLDLVPVLKPGDTVVIPANISYRFSKLVDFVTKVAIVANVYYLFFVRD